MLRISDFHAKLGRQISHRSRQLLALALNPRCVLCQLAMTGNESAKHRYSLCSTCISQLQRCQNNCRRCALPLPMDHIDSATICGECQKQQSPIEQIIALGWYQSHLRHLIQQFKYQGQLAAGRALSGAWLHHCQIDKLPQALIPVPSHRRKIRQRGFNPAALLAGDFGDQLSLPVDLKACVRLHPGTSQMGKDKTERWRQVQHMYRVLRCDYDHVAIVDDVVTTQATATTIAKQLKEHRVCRVDVWCIGRTP
ncbi:ComF family protein [Neiella sp. HB171785]|uniref:ComF family protein n=1 Tax=Neiella litorisoli TaxID=2771431 RepID=A0A8J6QW31_9GAMM|nr:ComF family protein [Neiella litorisoli]MBD1391123.1 ComF family protein [Neiella litorisoli]